MGGLQERWGRLAAPLGHETLMKEDENVSVHFEQETTKGNGE
jgi:hypothetical protein